MLFRSILTPLTGDNGAVELYLDNLDPNVVGLAGTALAPTILQGTQLLQAANGSASRALVIMSDGEAFDDHDAAIMAAKNAAKAGISVITVGFGTENGAEIPVREGGQIVAKRDEDGQIVITKYDPKFLREVAEAGHGEFIAATDGDRGGRLASALGRLDAAQREVEEGLARPLQLAWFLVPAILLLLLDAWRTDGGNWDRLKRIVRFAIPLLLVVAWPSRARAQDPMALYKAGKYAEAAARWKRRVADGDPSVATLPDLLGGLVLRGALRHHAVGLNREPLGIQRALQHDFRIALEGVRHHTGVGGADNAAVALDLEPVIHRVRFPHDGVGNDIAMQLQLLAVPLIRLRHDFVDVLVVLRAFGHRRIQQRAERHREHHTGEADLYRFVLHNVPPAGGRKS